MRGGIEGVALPDRQDSDGMPVNSGGTASSSTTTTVIETSDDEAGRVAGGAASSSTGGVAGEVCAVRSKTTGSVPAPEVRMTINTIHDTAPVSLDPILVENDRTDIVSDSDSSLHGVGEENQE